MKTLVLSRDPNGGVTDLRLSSDTINTMVLVASTSKRQAIPSNAKKVLINSTDNIYVKVGNSSVTASSGSDLTDGSGSELNPFGYDLPSDATHIACISAGTPNVTLSFYG